MPDAETRALGRAAALLLALSVVRWGWSRAHPPAEVAAGTGPNVLPELIQKSRAGEADAQRRARPLGAQERIDPNRASAADLDRLPGVGPSVASAIVEERKRDGPYQRPEELLRVHGVGKGTLARIRDHLDLSHPPPARRPASAPAPTGVGAVPSAVRPPLRAKVDPNTADPSTLETLPGVGPVLARRIVESRRRQRFQTLQDLTRVKGIGPASLKRLRDRVTLPPGG